MDEPRRLRFETVDPNRAAPCQILGLSPEASSEEIEAAYRAAVRRCPPERDPEGFRRAEQARRELTGSAGLARKLFGWAWEIPADWALGAAGIRPDDRQGMPGASEVLAAELFLYAVRALLLEAGQKRASQSTRAAASLERVRTGVFGGVGTKDMPRVTFEAVAAYVSFLLARVPMPFKASVLSEKPGNKVTVVSLSVRHPGADSDGILCAVKAGRGEKSIPLKDVEAVESGPVREMIEDYRFWFGSAGR